MSNKKMTAVDFAFDKIETLIPRNRGIDNHIAFEESKQKEKEQLIEFSKWILENCTFWGNEWYMYKGYRYYGDELLEQYYKETYNNDNN